MARRGGYNRSTNDEWMKVSRRHYAEAIQSADAMGQDLTIWLCDAIAFHAYRCEVETGKKAYTAACRRAGELREPMPMEADFKPRRPTPKFTTNADGQGREAGSRRPGP